MFSVSGVQQPAMNDSQASDSFSTSNGVPLPAGVSNVLRVPAGTRSGALSQIEGLLEALVDAISNGDDLVIPYQSTRTYQNGANAVSSQGDGRPVDVVKFPGRTAQEAKRFGTRDQEKPLDSQAHFRCYARGPLSHH